MRAYACSSLHACRSRDERSAALVLGVHATSYVCAYAFSHHVLIDIIRHLESFRLLRPARPDRPTPGKTRYFREVEVKHGRVAMLGAVSFVLAESFPSALAATSTCRLTSPWATPLQDLWQGVVATIGIIDSSPSRRSTAPSRSARPSRGRQARGWRLHVRPARPQADSPTKLAEMQAKELNSSRLAMIAMAGRVGQELATGSKLF